MKRLITLITSLMLAACGGGGGGNDPAVQQQPTEVLFVATNAWNSTRPPDAEPLTADEFRRRQLAGELQVLTATAQEDKRSVRRAAVEAERQYLSTQSDLSNDTRELLAQAAAANTLEAESVSRLPDGRTVVFNELATRIESAAASHRLARDPANALAAYTRSHALLTDSLQSGLPLPSALSSATLAQIKAATAQLEQALSSKVDIDGTRLDPETPVTIKRALTAGNGLDNNGACAPTGLAKRYWFPLRAFVSPIKSQGERGTCWAFAAVAAVESRERVQNNNTANVSEQFLVNKVKREWFESDFVDGGSAASALNAAVDRNQTLMPEAGWTYNPASGRPDNAFSSGVAGSAASYAGACNGYSGWCSETAHQSQRSCTNVLGLEFCGFNKQSFNGAGVAASRVRQIWSNGETFNLNQYRALLASGVSLIASFPVYEGIMAAPATGIVSDYRKQMRDVNGKMVDGTYGGHLVQVVGFISNEAMSWPGAAASAVGGGGYFVIRNSWGCAGDGGYFYVPADYVSSLFSTLETLDFDARRSAAWTSEQVTPGGSSGLAINPMGSKLVDLRVQDNLASSFAVTHPVANYVRLTVTSNRDGQLYDGQWLVNAPQGGSLFANSLPVTFQSAGLSTLTITARYGNQAVSVSKDIVVYNSPPDVRLQSNGVPRQGEDFVIDAIATDRNESDPAAMCATMSWATDAPDTQVSGSGCSRVIRFGATGSREVRVSTQDSEGRQASAIGTYSVEPPPVNPYPRVINFGLYARDSLRLGNQIVGCTNNVVANNALVDLRQIGCEPLSVNPKNPTRYFSQLGIENPQAEVLSYDWTYTAYYPNPVFAPRSLSTRTTTPSYNMAAIVFGARDTAYLCTLDVRVNAPEASRSQTQRVWSGQCINVEDAPR